MMDKVYFKKGENHGFYPWMKPIQIVPPKAGTKRNRAPRALPVGIYIGTSGWQYDHWRGSFYPERQRGTSFAYPQDLAQKAWLKFYSLHFDTVEVNSSFYRQTEASTFEKWKRQVPENFVFSIKGNRFITHIKRLKESEGALKVFFGNALTLFRASRSEEPDRHFERWSLKKHVILWQLPPSLKKDLDRLRDFLELLAKTAFQFRHAFEFRHESWLDRGTFDILIHNAVAATIVFQDWKDWPVIAEGTENYRKHKDLIEKLPFIYIRLHGNRVLYTSGYSDAELSSWARNIKKWLKMGRDVHAYFNNDAAGFAAPNALILKKLI